MCLLCVQQVCSFDYFDHFGPFENLDILNSETRKQPKRADYLRNRNRAGIRSCYCRLRSSHPVLTSNDEKEKIDFQCHCRRPEQLGLFKQHKTSETDNYVPTSSRIRSSYRSRYYRNRNRAREPGRNHNLIRELDYERRRRRRRRNRPRQLSNDVSTIDPPSVDGLTNDDSSIGEEESEQSRDTSSLNETYPNELMCSCNVNGCKGNCEHLSGCVCSEHRCWGDACRSPLGSLNLNSQMNHQLDHQVNSPMHSHIKSPHLPRLPLGASPSDLIDLIYLTKKPNRMRKLKNMNEIYGQAESSMSRMNIDYPTILPSMHHQSPIHHALHPISHQTIQPFIPTPSQLTFKTLILNEMENSNQSNNGQCHCLANGRCTGSECNNLKGCICDKTGGCYGRYCYLFKNYYSDQFNYDHSNSVRMPDQDYEYRQLPKVRYQNLGNQFDTERQPVDEPEIGKHYVKEYGKHSGKDYGLKDNTKDYSGKESSKAVKCEKIVDDHESVVIKQNKTQSIKLTQPTKDDDDKSLNAYEMLKVKLIPVSSSHHINKEVITISNDQIQNRIK